jgi:hypothetical protein
MVVHYLCGALSLDVDAPFDVNARGSSRLGAPKIWHCCPVASIQSIDIFYHS